MAKLERKHLPRKKVAAAGAGGAGVTALVTILAQFGIEVTPEAAAAACTLVAFVAGYCKAE